MYPVELPHSFLSFSTLCFLLGYLEAEVLVFYSKPASFILCLNERNQENPDKLSVVHTVLGFIFSYYYLFFSTLYGLSILFKNFCMTNKKGMKILDLVYRARFCKAVTELQITGLIRMPSKRRPDFVQRVAFGL